MDHNANPDDNRCQIVKLIIDSITLDDTGVYEIKG